MMLLALLFCIGLVPSTEAFVQCVCCMTSSFDSPLNVRDAPSTGGNIIGEIYPNECLLTTGCSGGWCDVTYLGQNAYVSHDYVSGPQACGHPSDGTCFESHCGFGSNIGRECDAYGCGHFGAPRGSRLHLGTDVECSAGQAINAPFDGFILQSVPPYGDGSCCDNGFEFQSTDPDWPNYFMVVFYASDYTIGASYSKGQQIATHIGLHCGCYPTSMTDHSHVDMYIGFDRLDPTSYLYCNYKS